MGVIFEGDLARFEPDGKRRVQSSYSSIMLHRKCPQAWFYRYGMGLEQVQETPSPYLILGSWWSALRAVESAERGLVAGTLKFFPERIRDKDRGLDLVLPDASLETVFEQAKQFWKTFSNDAKAAFVEALGEPLPDRLHNLYVLWDSATRDRYTTESPVGVEVWVERELPKPAVDQSWGIPKNAPTMKLVGFIDEIFLDNERGGMLVIRDHKTSKDIGSGTGSLDDLMDSQLELYAWLSAPMLREAGLPTARAVAYDRIRSITPKTPVLTASGGLSKAVTSYPLETYFEWLRKDSRPLEELRAGEVSRETLEAVEALPAGPFWGTPGAYFASGKRAGEPKFGVYELDEKEVARLSAPAEQMKWVRRTVSPVNQNTVKAHLRAAVDTALDIWQTQVRVDAVGEGIRNLTRQGCRFCEFAPFCRAQLIGGPDGDYDLASFGLQVKKSRKNGEKKNEQ